MPEDRRAGKRSSFTNAVRYQRKGSQFFANSVGRNISESGISFMSREFFPLSTSLIFELQDPATREYVKTAGEIVWISNQPHSENFFVGAKFTEPVTPV